MVKLATKAALATAAYTLVDLNSIEDDELRNDIIDDAVGGGGGRYGIRVVEEVVNGGARAPIFGYYKDGPDADRWENAKKELGFTSSDVDDGEVIPPQIEVTDARREAAIREHAAEVANVEAARERVAEDDEVAAITGSADDRTTAARAAQQPRGNIVDTTLASDATNRVDDPDREEGDSGDGKPASKKSTNKAPK